MQRSLEESICALYIIATERKFLLSPHLTNDSIDHAKIIMPNYPQHNLTPSRGITFPPSLEDTITESIE